MKKAFTLIELLVVIAIIAILAAILFPVFAQAKAAAKQTSSLSNVKQIMLSVFMYNNDSDDTQPPYMWENRGDGEWVTWNEMLNPYVKSANIFLDPSGPTTPSAVGVTNCTQIPGAKIISNYITPGWISYGYDNWWGTTMFAGFPVESNAFTNGAGGPCSNLQDYQSCTGMTRVAEPASTTYLVPGYTITYPRKQSTFGWPCTTSFAPQHDNSYGATNQVIQVYRKGENYGLADGHSKYFSSAKMNGDASRPHNYGGVNYPSSPYMVVQE